MKKSTLAIAASVIAIIFSIISFVIVFTHTRQLNIDWAALLIATLIGLIGILIGWQIYTIVDFKKSTKEMIDNMTVAKEQIFITQVGLSLDVHHSLMMFFYYLRGNNDDTLNNNFNFYSHGILTIIDACYLKNYEMANAVIKVLNETLNNNVEVSSYNKSLLLNDIYRIKDTKFLIEFDTLRNSIIELKVTRQI